jgi:hypothetical protein
VTAEEEEIVSKANYRVYSPDEKGARKTIIEINIPMNVKQMLAS